MCRCNNSLCCAASCVPAFMVGMGTTPVPVIPKDDHNYMESFYDVVHTISREWWSYSTFTTVFKCWDVVKFGTRMTFVNACTRLIFSRMCFWLVVPMINSLRSWQTKNIIIIIDVLKFVHNRKSQHKTSGLQSVCFSQLECTCTHTHTHHQNH